MRQLYFVFRAVTGTTEACTGNHPWEVVFSKSIKFDPCRDKSNFIFDISHNMCKNSGNTMWTCKDGGTCVHQGLVCDGYLHCPDGSDEDQTMCSQCPKQFGYPMDSRMLATFACPHR